MNGNLKRKRQHTEDENQTEIIRLLAVSLTNN